LFKGLTAVQMAARKHALGAIYLL